MDYRCPRCRHSLSVAKLLFSDISSCKECQQKVVLGDFLGFFVASVAMMVMSLSSLYILTERLHDYYVAAGYAIAIGMATGIIVLLLLGRATPYRPIRKRKAVAAAPTGSAPLSTAGAPLTTAGAPLSADPGRTQPQQR